MRLLFALLCLTLGVAAFADVTIEANQAAQGIMRVTYLQPDARAGATFSCQSFPETLLENQPVVDRVFENNTQQQLSFHLFSNQDYASYHEAYPQVSQHDFNAGFLGSAWTVCFDYPNPVPAGGGYTTSITIHSKTNWITRDAQGRWFYQYETSMNDVFFVLPQSQAIVYASEPVLVYERNGGTVVEIKRGNGDGTGQSRKIIFKTRAP